MLLLVPFQVTFLLELPQAPWFVTSTNTKHKYWKFLGLHVFWQYICNI